MRKSSKSSIILFIFLKYLVFFLSLMVIRNDYRLFTSGLTDGITYFALFMLPLPAVMALVFTYPLFYIFQLRRASFVIPALTLLAGLEHLLYTVWASSEDLMNGFYNALTTVGVGLLFFGAKNRLNPRKKTEIEP